MSKPVTLTLTLLLAFVAACNAPPDPRRTGFRVERSNVVAQYDDETGRLRRLEVDRDRNGFVETLSYWDGTKLEQIAVDTDEDGTADRWEHYDDMSQMVSVGTSSRDDGVEDVWTFPGPDGGTARIETDTDRDGRVDKWEHYDVPATPGGPPILRVVELDPEHTGQPTRRLHYNADGSFDRTEAIE